VQGCGSDADELQEVDDRGDVHPGEAGHDRLYAVEGQKRVCRAFRAAEQSSQAADQSPVGARQAEGQAGQAGGQGRTPLQIGPDVRLRQVHGRYRDSSLQYPGHEEDMLRAK